MALWMRSNGVSRDALDGVEDEHRATTGSKSPRDKCPVAWLEQRSDTKRAICTAVRGKVICN